MKLVKAAEYLHEKPYCLSTLRLVLKGLAKKGESEGLLEQSTALCIVDVLPSVLRQQSKKVATLGLEIVGALSLISRTINHLVASNKQVIVAVADILMGSDVELLTSVCYALEDLLITPDSIGAVQGTLLLENLLRMLCLLADLSLEAEAEVVNSSVSQPVAERSETPDIAESSLFTKQRRRSKRIFCSEFHTLVDTGIRNISNIVQSHGLQGVPRVVYLKALSILQDNWFYTIEEDQLLHDVSSPITWNWYMKCRSRHEIAKCLVLLGMEYESFSSQVEEVKSFEIAEVSTQSFRVKIWERLPMLVTESMPPALTSFAQRFSSLEKLVTDLLSSFTTCPSTSADQVDPYLFFRDIQAAVGDPLTFGHDMRMVKTVRNTDRMSPNESEVYFHPSHTGKGETIYVHPHMMLKAALSGFSLAVKGLELRCPEIASLSESLARQFGQPSVGVNLYVTPRDAQGLAVHFDDHCVLVCQLLGKKAWRIFSPVQILPRLYGSRSLDSEALKNSTVEEICLEEGNTLYIPRGYPHKAFCGDKFKGESVELDVFSLKPGYQASDPSAPDPGPRRRNSQELIYGRSKKQKTSPSCCTFTGGESAAENRISIHLTFGVEVEPPFEWEGMVHIALRVWADQRWAGVLRENSDCHNTQEALTEALLHIALRILGDKDGQFRKACMIAAQGPFDSLDAEPVASMLKEEAGGAEHGPRCCAVDRLECESCALSAVNYFQGLIAIVVKEASYTEALKLVQRYVYVKDRQNELDIVGMEWLRHVSNSSKRFEDSKHSDPVYLVQHSDVEKLVPEASFTKLRGEFGQALMFHDASQVFRHILSMYRTMREKYRNGMLALHGGLGDQRYYME